MKRRAELRRSEVAARESRIALVRQYRRGELPDVQRVTPAAFLGPLGASARCLFRLGRLPTSLHAVRRLPGAAGCACEHTLPVQARRPLICACRVCINPT
jgi:hypothetical protein